MQNFKQADRELLAAASFLILVPALAHLMFSWMGFTPTDEGFTLAHSRRILEGQVPHRDFIIIRPILSPLVHVPFVAFGGDYTFWLSRLFVWFQLACISWCWVHIISRLVSPPFAAADKIFIALIAFAATTHTKHITAWHTIDGLFFIAVGLTLCVRNHRFSKLAGYFLIGLSPLCKQGFIFVPPLMLLISGDWRVPRYWMAAASPGCCYVIYLVPAGALPDALIQLSSHTGLLSPGVLSYTRVWVVLSAAVGYVSSRLSLRQTPGAFTASRWFVTLTLYGAPLAVTAVSLWSGGLYNGAFLLFGLLLGASFCLITADSEPAAVKRAFFLVLLTAWSASLSVGYNSPALAAGPILAALLAYVFLKYKGQKERILRYSLPAAAALILLCFGVGRVRHIYRDQPAGRLNRSVEGVLHGGKRIFTNPNTFEFMSDLQMAVGLAERENKQYAILPDVAAHWVKSPQGNPLPADWPQGIELKNQALLDDFIKTMEAKRAGTVFIVQKVEAEKLASGFTPLDDSDYYAVVRHVRTRFMKINETSYFELYR